MKNNCPKCNSKQTYRKHPHDLKVYCDSCGFTWEANQVIKPLLEQKVYRRNLPNITVMVWICPNDRSKYSFSLGVIGGAIAFNEYEDPYLSDSFDTPQAALEAGIAEAKKP